MRVLFTFVGGRGHFEPLVPFARAVVDAGHSVAFGCGKSLVAMVEAAGLAAFPIGNATSDAATRLPLLPVDREREARDLRERFVDRTARYRAPRALTLLGSWKPDVVVCDETDFGVMIAAERAGIPHASVLVIAAGGFVTREAVGEALGSLRAEHGLPADPGLAMLSRHLVLSPFPPSYRDPADPLPATAHSFRPAQQQAPAQQQSPASDAARWTSARPGAPCVYFTLGTIFNMECGDLQTRVLGGLRELPINLLATVGHEIDPAEFGSQPSHVQIEQYVPQASVLPHCDLVVSHAGSGSVMGALSLGIPSLLIPIGADQPQNAERCRALGVAEVLDAVEATPESVRAAAASVLADPSYRENAQHMQGEIAALPGPELAVGLLEQLASSVRLGESR